MHTYFPLEFLNKENEKYEPTAVHKTRKFYQVCLNSSKGIHKSS